MEYACGKQQRERDAKNCASGLGMWRGAKGDQKGFKALRLIGVVV